MDRRNFLKSGAMLAGAMCLDFKTFAATVGKMGSPNLVIGVLSDIHIRIPEDVTVLEKTFKYFRDRHVDGVLIAGDMADTGLERQMKLVADTWFRVFPKDKLPDGSHVERLFVYGNHDFEGQNYGEMDVFLTKEQQEQVKKTELINDHKAEYWKKYYHEKYQQIYMKDVKGYKFIGAHWGTWEGTPGIKEFLDKNHAKLVGTKPFFFFQHPHPKNTCSGPLAWGHDNGDSTKALSEYPNCVAFSGHSHHILNDERTIWQGAFTSVGTASLRYTYSFGGRENLYVNGDPHEPSQMQRRDQDDGKQGMVMNVYDDKITLERHDFMYDKPLADNWIIPLPAPGDKPLSFEYRAEHAKVPQFAAGDKATVTRAMGKDRYGVEQMQTTVHFPNILQKRNGVRAFDFEVQLEMRVQDITEIFYTKRVMSPHFYSCEDMDEGEVFCVYGEHEVPKNRDFRFAVRPCECFGKKGDPIYTDWLKV